MTSQANNRREGGSTSCRGRSWKLRYIYKYVLLGALTIGGGSAQPRGGGGGSQRSQISLQSRPEYRKTASFPRVLTLKLPKTTFFTEKHLTKYTPKMFFEEYINFKIFCYLRHYGVITVQSLGSHIKIKIKICLFPHQAVKVTILTNIIYNNEIAATTT
jgi:hypothetical protein